MVISLFLFSMVLCCTRPIRLTGVVKEYSHKGNFIVDTVIFEKKCDGDSIYYKEVFYNTGRMSLIKAHTKNRSKLYSSSGVSNLIKTKRFIVNNKNFKIYKYLYDEKGGSDEEEVFFFNEHYGLLLNFWLNEGFPRSSEYDDISTELVQQILADTTGFYMEKIPPPPLMPVKEK